MRQFDLQPLSQSCHSVGKPRVKNLLLSEKTCQKNRRKKGGLGDGLEVGMGEGVCR